MNRIQLTKKLEILENETKNLREETNFVIILFIILFFINLFYFVIKIN